MLTVHYRAQRRVQGLLAFVFASSVALFLVWGTASCERYEQKKAARERRMEYLRSLTDSARKAHDAHGDSVRMLREKQ